MRDFPQCFEDRAVAPRPQGQFAAGIMPQVSSGGGARAPATHLEARRVPGAVRSEPLFSGETAPTHARQERHVAQERQESEGSQLSIKSASDCFTSLRMATISTVMPPVMMLAPRGPWTAPCGV